MSLLTETTVLVVGAGPTGLASAITLADLGVPVTIVDSSPTNKNGSRAAVVHAHTLETLHTIGLARPLMDAGILTTGFLLSSKNGKIFEIDLTALRDYTEFPLSVLIAQHVIERIFEEKLSLLGIQVLRNKTVIGIRLAALGPGVDVTFEDTSVIRARYVIAADGSKSTLRRLAGIEFKDPDTGIDHDDASHPSFQLVLSDVYLEEPLPPSIPRDRASGYLDNFLLLVPLPSDASSNDKATSFWRIGYGILPGSPDAPRKQSLEYLQQQMDERNPWGTKVSIASFTDSSRYRVRSAIASTYFQKIGEGNILLAGDAAHVHSPAGGQGMNLGICDGVALGQAIHSHIEATNLEERDSLFRHYNDSRRKIAIRVIGITKGLNTLINANAGWRRVVRNMIFWIIRPLPFINRMAAWRVSGLGNRTN